MVRKKTKWIFLLSVIGTISFTVCSFADDVSAPVQRTLPATETPMTSGEKPDRGADAGQAAVFVSPVLKKVAVQRVLSANKAFGAVADPDRKTITVEKIDWQGNFGRSKKYWETTGSFEILGLLNDGDHLVAGTKGTDILPFDYKKDQVMLTFFKTGNPIAQLKLQQLISDFSKLEKVESGYRWGRYLGLNAAGHFVVETIAGGKIMFDVRTGKPTEFKADEGDGLPGWKTCRDIMRCYAFQYPAHWILKEWLDVEGMQTGDALLQIGDKGRTLRIAFEDLSLYPSDFYEANRSFETFAIDRVKAMNMADGCGSSSYVGDVVKKEVFRNRYNLKSMGLYLLIVHETSDDDGEGTVEKEIKCPVYVVSILQPDEQMHRILFFEFADDGGGNAPEEKELLRKIVDTVKILK